MNQVSNSVEPSLVTFILIAFNQERFIREALEGALAQDYWPMEFIFSDDCSADRTFEIMQDVCDSYKGANKVILNRNDQNLGLVDHLNRLHRMSSGRIIIHAAGDDVSLPARTKVIVEAFRDQDPPSLVMSNAMMISAEGEDLGLYNAKDTRKIRLHATHPLLIEPPGFNGCTVAIHRELVDNFPPLIRLLLAEDTIFVRRAALKKGISFLPEALVRYRIHGANVSQQQISSRSAYLSHKLKWLDDISNQYVQLRLDMEAASSVSSFSPEGYLEKFIASNNRRKLILTGNLGESIWALLVEVTKIPKKAVIKEVFGMFAIRWITLSWGTDKREN